MAIENIIKIKSIHEILMEKDSFFIPSYQRGYRWTEIQVSDLLEDIWEFANKKDKNPDEFYCLQPIVVKGLNGSWELIDGQQRLTTLLIILKYYNNNIYRNPKPTFQLEFETRKSSKNFLDTINQDQKEENIDYYHICIASAVIEKWFVGREKIEIFYDSIVSDTKIIWYQVSNDTDAIDIFTRINMGKIPLTNSELIKALFLKQDNFNGNEAKTHLKQLEIANEWDRIEYTLQNEEFWYFLNNGDKNDNRIEFILDLMAEEINNGFDKIPKIPKARNEYFSFMVFNQYFTSENSKNGASDKLKTIDKIWQEVKNYFLTFEEWFTNREFYHLAGFLVTDIIGENIQVLKRDSISMTKDTFKSYLISKIKKHMSLQVSELEYGNRDKNKIRKILLLFNIETLLLSKESSSRFPFNRYKKEKWDIEHIHSVQSEMPNDKNHQIEWLKEVLNDIKDKPEFAKIIDDILGYINQTGVRDFNFIFDDILKLYSENNTLEDINDISNLTLLDEKTNRGYKNAVFQIKRKVIIKKDKNGIFIPLCTKNVFLKYYNENVSQMSFWGKEDRISYLATITETLEKYLPKQINSFQND